MSEHTQGPVYLVSVVEKDHERQTRRVHNIFNRDGLYAHIAECGNADNARRLVAAWNACQGIPTEVLEAQQSGGLPWSVADQIEARVMQAELVAALKALRLAREQDKYRSWERGVPNFNAAEELADAAIARATVGKT